MSDLKELNIIIFKNKTTRVMVDLYELFPKHYPHELFAIQRSTREDPVLGKICLLTQISTKDQYIIQDGYSRTQSALIQPGDWLIIQVTTQKIWTPDGLKPLVGWVQAKELRKISLCSLEIPVGALNLTNRTTAFLSLAKFFLGKPYRWGGVSLDECDCSGLTYLIYQQMGKEIPRFSDGQYAVSQPISPKDLKAGDLIFGLYQPQHPEISGLDDLSRQSETSGKSEQSDLAEISDQTGQLKKQNWKFPEGNPIHVLLYCGESLILESCGLPEINSVRLINFFDRYGISPREMTPGWRLPNNPNYVLHFGRP